ncbi:MAG: CpXC domain-containing protein [Candidatus Muiribacteriota bacterium]
MLIKKEHDIKCPNCNTSMRKELWNIIDARLTKEAVDEILEGTFNVAVCNRCKTDFYCEVPFIYQDMEKNLFATVLPLCMKEQEAELKKTMESVSREKNIDNELKKMIFFGIISFQEFLKKLEQ